MLRIIIFALFLFFSFALGQYSWNLEKAINTTVHAPSPRYHFGFSVLSNRTGVLVGGFDFDNGGIYLNDTWLYHFENKTWTRAIHGNANLTRAYFTAHTYKHEVVIFGGVGPGEVEKGDVWRYSIANNTWTQDTFSNLTSTLIDLIPRQFHSSTIIGDKLYIFGGHAQIYGRTSNSLLSYDLNTTRWSILSADGSSGPTGRQGASLEAYEDPTLGPSLILFGGYSDKPYTGGYNDAWQYVILKGAWIELTQTGAPAGRYSHDAVILKNSLVIYGGLSTHNVTQPPTYDTYYSDVWSLQLSGGGVSKWVQELAASAPGNRQGHQSAVVNGTFYTLGGYIQYFGLANDVWSLQGTPLM